MGFYMTAVRYRDEVPDPTVRLYAGAVDHAFVLIDDDARPLQLSSSKTIWRVRG